MTTDAGGKLARSQRLFRPRPLNLGAFQNREFKPADCPEPARLRRWQGGASRIGIHGLDQGNQVAHGELSPGFNGPHDQTASLPILKRMRRDFEDPAGSPHAKMRLRLGCKGLDYFLRPNGQLESRRTLFPKRFQVSTIYHGRRFRQQNTR